MLTPDFTFNPDTLVAIAIRIAIILVLALVLTVIQKKLIPRIITARIPKIREESQDQIAIRSKTLTHVITQSCSVLIWSIAFMMVLGAVGVDITPLLASLGVGALAIGFAAQNIIRDFLNGFFIFMEDWYRAGEWVTISGMEGDVEKITLRRTVLREINGTMHVIPNSQIPLASNQTRDWARINLYITVAYKEDISHVYTVINEVCQELKEDPDFGTNLTTTPSAMRVSDLGAHGVDICIRGYTKAGEQWGLTGELRKRIKNRFDLEGIEIPWPHTKVYFGDTQRTASSTV